MEKKLGRPKKACEDKYICPIRSYVKEVTYEKLVAFARKRNIDTAG
jgi:hypothetical protein